MPARPAWAMEKWDLLGLLGIPLLLLLVNPVWLSNKFDDADTWLYYGHFQQFYNPAPAGSGVLIDYIRTRLPYILPGAVLYRVLADDVARVALMLLVYCGTVVPFWYVVRAHAGRQAAFATTGLLATDLFFIRTVGWQYVDGAVLAYQALTFAFINAAVGSAKPRRYFAAAGFTAASMVFTHLAAACLLPVFAGYAAILLARALPDMSAMQRTREPLVAAIWGGLACQLFYGLILSVLYGYFFVFLFEQLHLAISEAAFMTGSLPLGFLAGAAGWLVVPGIALAGGAIALAASLMRGRSPREVDVFFFLCVSVMFAALLVFEVLHLSYFLSREGLYTSFLLILAYFAIGALLFPPGQTGWGRAFTALALMLAVTGGRLWFNGSPPFALALPVLALAVIGGLAIAVPSLLPGAWARLAALLVFAGVSALTPWHFHDDGSIRATSRLIRLLAGERVPRIFFAADDRIGTGPLRAIVASFTERAWGRHGEAYPDFTRNAWPPLFDFHDRDVVVVLSSAIADAAVPRQELARHVAAASMLGSFRVERPDATLWAHVYEVHLPARP